MSAEVIPIAAYRPDPVYDDAAVAKLFQARDQMAAAVAHMDRALEICRSEWARKQGLYGVTIESYRRHVDGGGA